jgi:hypothetical protein
MRFKSTMIALLLSTVSVGQTDYYVEPAPVEHVMTKQESRDASRHERIARKLQKKTHDGHGKCYCPYQTSTSVWDDIWNAGVVGTTKAVYQSTIKPQVIGEVVGAAQGATADSPLPALVGETAVVLGISEANKARRHQRNRQPPQAGVECNCDPCPYHGPRYKPNQGIK